MIFKPEKCAIPDKRMAPFISTEEIWSHLQNTKNPDATMIRDVIKKSLSKERLTLRETAILINANTPEFVEEIKQGACELKKRVYGNRIVLFAPLYIGNFCINNCQYCGFRTSNKTAVRKTLTDEEIIREIEALEDNGQKRLILVYGEHSQYTPEYIAHTVDIAYHVKKKHGEIRRVNINAAPFDIQGFRTVKGAGIGTYQIFQETYHPEAYTWYHLSGKKRDYEWRLTALDRAQEAGIDDVGIGTLFGLYHWQFEVMAMVRHANHLEACYHVGPHTISFPRIKESIKGNMGEQYFVNNDDFARLIAILRLAVPYTGLILTAREDSDLRHQVMQFGVSQIDGGTKLEIGSYADSVNEEQNLNREQFKINDSRSLNDIINELIQDNYLPSFCTACYRKGRTGEHFMEFSVPGFIKRFCTPNAILTLVEYLEDYAPESTKITGWKVIEDNIKTIDDVTLITELRDRINRILQGERDIYF